MCVCKAYFHYFIVSCVFHNSREQEKHEFDVHEVYGIDVIISTGEGRVSTTKTITT